VKGRHRFYLRDTIWEDRTVRDVRAEPRQAEQRLH